MQLTNPRLAPEKFKFRTARTTIQIWNGANDHSNRNGAMFEKRKEAVRDYKNNKLSIRRAAIQYYYYLRKVGVDQRAGARGIKVTRDLYCCGTFNY